MGSWFVLKEQMKGAVNSMERILTNLQIEWLTNIKLLSEYEDEFFSKEDMSEKFSSYVEHEYPDKEISIVYELQVLREKGFLVLETEEFNTSVIVNNVNITKKGLDYLIMLEEDFAEKLALNQNVLNMLTEKSKENKTALNKDILDYVEQISTIISNISGLIPSVGNFCQGAIPFAKSLVRLTLKK
jgi:DNA-binding PadR family transcriptional regulator